MARKSTTFVVTGEGRDNGKTFLITEMSAMRGEKWAARALSTLARSGVDLGEDIMQAGMAGIVAIGIRAITTLDFAEAEPLLDEMFDCVEFIPDPARPEVKRRPREDDIEEVASLLSIRNEVIELHVGFSIAAALSKLGAAAKVGTE